jgi:transposase InsO family protein
VLSDNGPSYAAAELADWLGEQGMGHTRGKTYHPMTQGKIERWHLSLEEPHPAQELLSTRRSGACCQVNPLAATFAGIAWP